MFANSMTINSHLEALLEMMKKLHRQGITIINSGIYNAGFLTASDCYNYEPVSRPASNKLLKKAAGAPKEILNTSTDIREPLIKDNEKDLSVALPQTWLYDFAAAAGKSYILIGK